MNFIHSGLWSENYTYCPVNLDFCQTLRLDKNGKDYLSITFRMSDNNEISWLFRHSSDAENMYKNILKHLKSTMIPRSLIEDD